MQAEKSGGPKAHEKRTAAHNALVWFRANHLNSLRGTERLALLGKLSFSPMVFVVGRRDLVAGGCSVILKCKIYGQGTLSARRRDRFVYVGMHQNRPSETK